mmetsp:Transcript_13167/g.41675  ORF Transcript_13167/g.41675 Transcript_13167/m.41675 type:complete len:239 (-) Transcript_13167:728-1444(-)
MADARTAEGLACQRPCPAQPPPQPPPTPGAESSPAHQGVGGGGCPMREDRDGDRCEEREGRPRPPPHHPRAVRPGRGRPAPRYHREDELHRELQQHQHGDGLPQHALVHELEGPHRLHRDYPEAGRDQHRPQAAHGGEADRAPELEVRLGDALVARLPAVGDLLLEQGHADGHREVHPPPRAEVPPQLHNAVGAGLVAQVLSAEGPVGECEEHGEGEEVPDVHAQGLAGGRVREVAPC